jgi:LmbE family N-acetylglucosaminyl deacetylase
MYPIDIPDLGTILSIWAHPDDETYLSGGVMAAAAEQGLRVVCVSATAGELGSPDPVTWPPDRLGPVRRWEAAAAMAVLGVDDHRLLGLPDGGLDAHDGEGSGLVRALLDEIRPDTILTFGADGVTGHPDHIAVHRWVTEAWRQHGCSSRLLYAVSTAEHLDRFNSTYETLGVYMSDDRPAGVPVERLALHARFHGRELDRKVTALRAMATQTGALTAALDELTYAAIVAEEAFVDASSSFAGDAAGSQLVHTSDATR